MDQLYLLQPSEQAVFGSGGSSAAARDMYATGIHVRVATTLDFIILSQQQQQQQSTPSCSSSAAAAQPNGLDDLQQPLLISVRDFAREVVLRTTTDAERSSDVCYLTSIILPALTDSIISSESDSANPSATHQRPMLHHVLHVLFVLHRLRHGLSGQVDKTSARLLLERMVRFINGFFFREERFYTRRDVPCEIRRVGRCRAVELAVVAKQQRQRDMVNSRSSGYSARRSGGRFRGRCSSSRRVRTGGAGGGGGAGLCQSYMACPIPSHWLELLQIRRDAIAKPFPHFTSTVNGEKDPAAALLSDVLTTMEVTRRQRVFEECIPVTLWPLACIVIADPSTEQKGGLGGATVTLRSPVIYSEMLHANRLCDSVDTLERAFTSAVFSPPSSMAMAAGGVMTLGSSRVCGNSSGVPSPVQSNSAAASVEACGGAFLIVDTCSSLLIPKLPWVTVAATYDGARDDDERRLRDDSVMGESRLSGCGRCGNMEWKDVPLSSLPALPLLPTARQNLSVSELPLFHQRAAPSPFEADSMRIPNLRCDFAKGECMTIASLWGGSTPEPQSKSKQQERAATDRMMSMPEPTQQKSRSSCSIHQQLRRSPWPCPHVDAHGNHLSLPKPVPRKRQRQPQEEMPAVAPAAVGMNDSITEAAPLATPQQCTRLRRRQPPIADL